MKVIVNVKVKQINNNNSLAARLGERTRRREPRHAGDLVRPELLLVEDVFEGEHLVCI